MLSISISVASPGVAILLLEGRIADEWVGLLASTCGQLLVEQEQLQLDLFEVSFIDNNGINLLHSLPVHRVAFVNCSGFISQQLRWPNCEVKKRTSATEGERPSEDKR
jgi:ABC-type transporter Mla MlaB component